MQNNNPVQKLKLYLSELKTLISQIDLNSQVYKEGTTVDQIAFHASQAANFWLKVRLLGQEFVRDKDSELTTRHSMEEINSSLDSAIAACDKLSSKDLDLNKKLSESVEMKGWLVDTIGAGLIFLTSHTAEHVAELTMIRDYVFTLK